MPQDVDIEVRVEQLASQINADPEAFATLLEGVRVAFVEDNPEPEQRAEGLGHALSQVAGCADIVAAYTE